eukprot:1893903-Alexandrium_andersonii.AAC.1
MLLQSSCPLFAPAATRPAIASHRPAPGPPAAAAASRARQRLLRPVGRVASELWGNWARAAGLLRLSHSRACAPESA